MQRKFLHYFVNSTKDKRLSSAYAVYDQNDRQMVSYGENEIYVNISAIEHAESKIDFGPYNSTLINGELGLKDIVARGGPLEEGEKIFLLYQNGEKDNQFLHDHPTYIMLSKNRRLFWNYSNALQYGISSRQEFSIWQAKDSEFELIHHFTV